MIPGNWLRGAELLAAVFADENHAELTGGDAEAFAGIGLLGGREDCIRARREEYGDEVAIFCSYAMWVEQSKLFSGATVVGCRRKDKQYAGMMTERMECSLSVCG